MISLIALPTSRKGAEFNSSGPAADADTTEASGTARSPAGRGQRILLLDDDLGFVELAKRVIEKAGYCVIGHSNTADALAEFAAAPDTFDLVVADLAMADASGIEIAQRLVAIRTDIPIIVTAAYIGPDDEALAAHSGIREVVSKSATVEELCMAFGRVLGPPG